MEILLKDGKRVDGRTPDELRGVRIECGVLHEADGSAYVEWGKNKVVAGVFGPRECIPKHEANPYRAIVKCRYNISPFASPESRGKMGLSRRSIELSKVIREVFEKVIITELFPKSQIEIYTEVLQADGGTRVASITAAAVALVDTGIPIREIVNGVAVGKIEDTIIIDPGKEEDNFGDMDIALAFSQRKNEILLLQMDGIATKEEIIKAIEMGMQTSKKIYALQSDALKRIDGGGIF